MKKKERKRKKMGNKRKKKKKKPHRGQKWVGRDKRLSKDIKPCETFFTVLKPIFKRDSFYAKVFGRFSGPKI